MAFIQQIFIEGPHYVPGMICQIEGNQSYLRKAKKYCFIYFCKMT